MTCHLCHVVRVTIWPPACSQSPGICGTAGCTPERKQQAYKIMNDPCEKIVSTGNVIWWDQ